MFWPLSTTIRAYMCAYTRRERARDQFRACCIGPPTKLVLWTKWRPAARTIYIRARPVLRRRRRPFSLSTRARLANPWSATIKTPYSTSPFRFLLYVRFFSSVSIHIYIHVYLYLQRVVYTYINKKYTCTYVCIVRVCIFSEKYKRGKFVWAGVRTHKNGLNKNNRSSILRVYMNNTRVYTYKHTYIYIYIQNTLPIYFIHGTILSRKKYTKINEHASYEFMFMYIYSYNDTAWRPIVEFVRVGESLIRNQKSIGTMTLH